VARAKQLRYKKPMSIAKKLRLYHRMQFAARRMQKAADRVLLASADITTAQAAVLIVVAHGESVTQRDVAKQLGLNESAITGMVTRLMKMELLERGEHDADTRAWRLILTRRGRTAINKIEKPFAAINSTIESSFSADELKELADYLTRLGVAFGED